jgi:hypothetical protein
MSIYAKIPAHALPSFLKIDDGDINNHAHQTETDARFSHSSLPKMNKKIKFEMCWQLQQANRMHFLAFDPH